MISFRMKRMNYALIAPAAEQKDGDCLDKGGTGHADQYGGFRPRCSHISRRMISRFE